MTTVYCRRVGTTLHPADEKSAELLARIPKSELIKIEVSRPRNAAFLRKFFVLLHLLHDNQSLIEDFEDFRGVFEVALGHCTIYGNVAVPKSISFAKLDQAGFESLWEKACLVATTKIIPNLSRADLEREIRDIIGA